MNLKFETIVQIFRKIIQLNSVINLESANEYYRKNYLKKWPQNGPLSSYLFHTDHGFTSSFYASPDRTCRPVNEVYPSPWQRLSSTSVMYPSATT